VKAWTAREVAAYRLFNRQPRAPDVDTCPSIDAFAQALTDALKNDCARYQLKEPRLLLEPGRAITGNAQILLVSVRDIKPRRRGGRFALTDGGTGRVRCGTDGTLSPGHSVLRRTCSTATGNCPDYNLVTCSRSWTRARISFPSPIIFRTRDPQSCWHRREAIASSGPVRALSTWRLWIDLIGQDETRAAGISLAIRTRAKAVLYTL
jgi:hypothetical protein